MPTGVPSPSPSPSLSTESRKLWVVLIGVNHYEDSAFADLQCPVEDCQDLEETLRLVTVTYFASNEFLTHHDCAPSQPTLDTITSSLERVALKAKPQDVVLIYFSGHGVMIGQNLYFCLADTKQDALETTGLSLELLLSYLERCSASQQHLWSDACYSGGFQFGRETSQTPLFKEVLQTRASQNQGFYALLSCTASQCAWEFPGLKHGIFTHFLIKGLRGGAANAQNLVEVDQIYSYVSLQTERFIQDINCKRRFLNEQNTEGGKDLYDLYPAQTPYRIVGGAGMLVLGYCPPPTVSTSERQALVVHEFVNSETNLNFCRALREYGDFSLDYWKEENSLLTEEENIQKNIETLKKAIVKLLNCGSEATVLLYFRGHLQLKNGELWLMASSNVGINRSWLSDVLSGAKVAHWILILDCPSKRDIYDLLAIEERKNFCILAAESPDFAQVLTQTLDKADLKLGLSLPAWIVRLEQHLRERQQKLYRWLGRDERLAMIVPEECTPLRSRDLNLCPYLGLKTFAESEVSYFCGRDDITEQLLGCLSEQSFVAVVGASGSGKSSVVQAGLIPALRRGELNNSQSWEIRTMRPGSAPLDALARALATPGESFESVKNHILSGPQRFSKYLHGRSELCILLVIDQFEELLTLASEQESATLEQESIGLEQKNAVLEKESTVFCTLLLEALENSNNYFKVVITLRSDFYASDQLPNELNRKISKHNITLIPMETSSYRAAIEQPAIRVGLDVEKDLLIRLLGELGSAGDLPLLAFVLQELWAKRQDGKLTLSAYEQIGGIKGILSRRADDIYDKIKNVEEQDCLRWILISLTKLGEKGALDSRQRISKEKLFDAGYSEALVEKTLKKLIDEKLVVVDFDAENQVVVEVAHEVLIRTWKKLIAWLDGSREQLQVLRNFQEKAGEWKKEEENEEYLLPSSQLESIKNTPKDIINKLSQEEQCYLKASQDKIIEIQQIENRRLLTAQSITLVVSFLLVVTIFLAVIATQRTQQLQQNQMKLQQNQIVLLNNFARSEREKYPLDALMKSMEAAHLLKHTSGASPEVVDETTSTLRYVLGMNHEVNRLEGHTDMVQTVAISPDGNFLVSGGHDNTVRIWTKEGKLLKTLLGHQSYVKDVAFSPNGKLIISSSQDGTIKFWNLSGVCLHTILAHRLGVTGLAFAPDRQQIASSGSDGTVKFWDYQGRLLKSIQAHNSRIWKIVFSSDGTLLASSGSDGTIKFWTPEGILVKTLSGHKGFVTALTFSPNSQQLISSGTDKTLRVWSREGKLLHVLKGFKKDILDPTFTSDGRSLIYCDDESGEIRIHNLHTGLIFTLSGHTAPATSLTVSSDNKYLASASQDRSIRIWKIDSNFQQMVKSEDPVSVDWAQAIDYIALSNYDGNLSLYKKFQDSHIFIKAHPSRIRDSAFSPDGKLFATLGYENYYKLWAKKGTLLYQKALSAKSISFTSDSKHIVLGTFEGQVQFLSLEGKLLHSFSAHNSYINQIIVSRDGQKILTASADGSIKLWNQKMKLLKILGSIDGENPYTAISPNSQLIAVSNSGKNVEILDIQGNLRLSLPSSKKVEWFRFSPDSQFIAVMYSDYSLDIWNTKGKPISTLGRLPSNYLAFDFSPDGKTLLTLGPSDSFLFWDWNTDLDSLLNQSCNQLHEYLSNNAMLSDQQRELCKSL